MFFQQQRQLILCKEFVSRVSEATLENFLVGFWSFPVLHCPCVSLCGSRFCLVVGASKLQDEEQQLEQEQKGSKNPGRCKGERVRAERLQIQEGTKLIPEWDLEVRHFFRAVSWLVRSSLPLCLGVPNLSRFVACPAFTATVFGRSKSFALDTISKHTLGTFSG